jgi:Na+/proline symporter
MGTTTLLSFVIGYFVVLLIVAYITSKNSNNEAFFSGNKNSNWLLVAFGMIGTSLSGVTFVSVPGGVGNGEPVGAFGYFQMVIGYVLGYIVIAFILLPLYYKMNLTSIYTYLASRMGPNAHKTGAWFFILSRTLGATARLYLVIVILQNFVLEKMGVPFWLTALVILLMILLYTFEGGVKTIVYTDTLQTTGMLVGLIACVIYIMNNLHLDFSSMFDQFKDKGFNKVVNSDANAKSYFWKHVLGGAFITITMTGLDQEMMQKNISVKKLSDSQKNVMTLAVVLVIVNLLFLILGGLLYLFAESKGINAKGDDLFPTIALTMNYLPQAMGIVFIIALISALFPSVDGAITALTSCFCIDIAKINNRINLNEKGKKRLRLSVHLSFALLFLFLVLGFYWINDKSIIDFIFRIAAFTYGPLLGLFAFGILTSRKVQDYWIPTICVIAVVLTFYLDFANDPQWYQDKFRLSGNFIENLKLKSIDWFGGKLVPKEIVVDGINKTIFTLQGGYKIGLELLIINGLFTFFGLMSISKRR